MKSYRIFFVPLVIAMVLVYYPSADAQFGDLLKGVEKTLKGEELSEDKIIRGLK